MGMSRRLQTSLVGTFGLSFLALAAGCSDETATSESDIVSKKPHVLALSTYEASLGTPVDVVMANPPPTTAKKFELIFVGKFKRGDGGEEDINITQPASRSDAGTIRWTTLGPFQNPFTPSNPDIGVFEGKVGIKTTLNDGTEQIDDKPLPIRFTVKPSIIVTELQPVEADCGKPAIRLIGQMTYKIKATTIGFKATNINYQFRIPNTVPDVSGRPVLDTDSGGSPQYRVTQLVLDPNVPQKQDQKAFTLPPVPEDIPSYGVIFGIVATDAEGNKVASTFGMTAHRPLDVFHDGRYQLAQVYPAQPVSACIPGGQQGRSVDYSEANTETRTRSVSITLSKNFTKGEDNNWSTTDGKSIQTSKTEQDGYSKSQTNSNSFTFERNASNTTGVSYTASSTQTKGVNASVGIKPAGGLIGGAEVGGNLEWSNTNAKTNSSSSTNGWSQSNTTTNSETNETNHSTATTDSTSVSKSDTKGGSTSINEGEGKANNDGWVVSSSDTIQRGFGGSVIANTYGVFYRQMARYTFRSFVLAYNMCGEGDIIGEVAQQDYIWAPDLALSNACPPLPQSNLPKPQCYLPPCDP